MEYMSKFRDWHVKTVFYYALLGMTEEQIATAFEVSQATINQWKNKFPTFLEAMRRGKEQADAKVVYSLYRAAIGYEHDSVQLFRVTDKTYDPNTGKLISEKARIIHEPVRKIYPPNVKAAIKWVECRQPGQWSNRTEVKKSLTVHHEVDLSKYTVEELKLLSRLGVRGRQIEDVPFETTMQKELAVQNNVDIN